MTEVFTQTIGLASSKGLMAKGAAVKSGYFFISRMRKIHYREAGNKIDPLQHSGICL
ncbi:hypothetical protein [Dryocola clanedunensis]